MCIFDEKLGSHYLPPKKEGNENLYFLNVGTGIDIEIKDLANLISKIIGFKGNINWDTSKPDGTPETS